MHSLTRNKLLIVTFLLTILFSLHYGIPLYATSTYLHIYFSSITVSFLYMSGSIAALIASIFITQHIKKFHTYNFTFSLVIAEIAAMILFAFTNNIWLIGLLFIIHFVLQTLIFICLNVFIESFSKYAETGSIRGLFLALLSTGILISPLIGGIIITHVSFEILYVVSAFTLIPFLLFLHKYLSHIKDPAYENTNMFYAFKLAIKNKDLRAALISVFIVECFYAVMIIYSPIYLQTLGISLTTYLTFILPVALLPLVVLPYEIGLLADTKWGEKEMLLFGLLILALTVFTCVIVTSSSPLVWLLIFLISRIGAACVETMAFTYYFKKIKPENSSLTALFANMRSLAVVTIGGVGVIISPMLVRFPQLMFIVLGCIILYGITHVVKMHDTL